MIGRGYAPPSPPHEKEKGSLPRRGHAIHEPDEARHAQQIEHDIEKSALCVEFFHHIQEDSQKRKYSLYIVKHFDYLPFLALGELKKAPNKLKNA